MLLLMLLSSNGLDKSVDLHAYTQKNLLLILVKSIEIRLYLTFLDCFGTNRNFIWFQIFYSLAYFNYVIGTHKKNYFSKEKPELTLL